MAGGVAAIVGSAVAEIPTAGVSTAGILGGLAMIGVGLDNAYAGLQTAISGTPTSTRLYQAIEPLAGPEVATVADGLAVLGAGAGWQKFLPKGPCPPTAAEIEAAKRAAAAEAAQALAARARAAAAEARATASTREAARALEAGEYYLGYVTPDGTVRFIQSSNSMPGHIEAVRAGLIPQGSRGFSVMRNTEGQFVLNPQSGLNEGLLDYTLPKEMLEAIKNGLPLSPRVIRD